MSRARRGPRPNPIPTRWPPRSRSAPAAARARSTFAAGPFVYRASFSILRQKAWHIAALAGALLLAGGIDVGARYSNLSAERKVLDKDLKTATQELFGQPRSDAEAITQLMKRGFREELAPVPKATAFDLLDQISRKVPPADKIKLDIGELDIRPKKTFLKGTVDTAAAVDEMAAKLKEIDCVEDVNKGADHRGVGRREAVHPHHRSEVPMSAFANLRQMSGRALRLPYGVLSLRVGADGAAHPEAGGRVAHDHRVRRSGWR